MEGKVKCSGCGWSWNKSDSSKKDMYVCHQCGKDNTMKNGGWLNKYDDGGPVQPNYNDSSVSMSDDFVGLGYDTKGRNYSPAWGGQFQGGGKLIPVSPMQQITGEMPTISPTVPYLQTKDPVEFYQSWIQSPEYARRQLLTGYSPSAKDESLSVPSAAASRQIRLESLQNIDPITYSTRQPSESRPGVYGSSSTVNINPLDYIDTNRGMVEAHELAHIAGAMESEGTTRPGVMSAKEQEIFKKSMLPMKEPVLSGPQGSQQREASKRALEDFMHSQKPKELKADLDALRFTMYDKGIYDITKGQKFTESDFEKAKQNLGKDRVFKRLENRVGKKNFVNLMNTIAKADGDEQLPMAMGGMSIPGSVGFTYARTGSTPSNGKYAKKTMASAQNGQEMKFYQNGLDWKPRSMQNGGEEMYEGQQLPEITITPYDEQYPFYQTLSPEQKKYINDEGPIGRGIRAIATTGKIGQTAKDISTPYRTVQEVASEVTGVPGTIRFSNDPAKNLKGAGKTLLDLGVSGAAAFSPTGYGSLGGYNPITKEELFNQQNLEGTFNTLDTFGLGSLMTAPIAKPIGIAAGKAVAPHLKSISNVTNETLDAIKEIDRTRQLEKLAVADVPALRDIDKVKDVRNFGKEIAELESKLRNPNLNELGPLREKYAKLSTKAKEIESLGITDVRNKLNSINDKLKTLSDFKLDDFISNLKKQGANKVALETLRNNPDLALRYSNTISSFSNNRMAEELITGDVLSALENFRTYPNLGKVSDFSPNYTNISTNRVDPTTADIEWSQRPALKKVDNKLYVDSYGWGDEGDEFYSYPFYKNIGDKIIDTYANLRLPSASTIPQIPNSTGAYELMPSLFADRYNVGSMLRQASRFIDENPDGVMFPARSLSADSYPLALNMMARELKNNPDSKLRLIGFDKSNELGFADRINNPELVRSELSQIVKELEGISGQSLPKPYINKSEYANSLILPKFAISKGSTNKAIQDYLNNSSIADRLGVKRGVYDASSNAPISSPPQTIDFDFSDYDFDTNFKNGGVTKDNRGYWNPDNWGQPVEIDSNMITMQGVYEPLLGVSDTGDTKLMKPGKNYKFKGEKVTEFPVAQYGKGIPFKDATNNPKDAADPIRKDLAPPIRPKASFEEQKRIAKLELDKYGYTSDQRKGYVKGKSEKAFKNIVPQGYGDLPQTLDRIERYEKNLGRNPMETLWYGAEESSTGKPIYYDLPKRDDAFALYLGLPQKNKSFGISEYQPGDSKENKYYFKPNYLDENLKNRLVASYFDNKYVGGDERYPRDNDNVYIANERGDVFPQKTDSLERAGVPFENPMYAEWMVDNPLGDFKMSKGKDEKGHYISIYDTWDLNPFKEGKGSSSNAYAATLKAFAKMKGVDVSDDTEISTLFGAGKPFEIYDRIYYDPKTKKVIPQKRNGGGVGINQLDAQPMKKLNQLLNFTNNPDKDNWLDKYN